MNTHYGHPLILGWHKCLTFPYITQKQLYIHNIKIQKEATTHCTQILWIQWLNTLIKHSQQLYPWIIIIIYALPIPGSVFTEWSLSEGGCWSTS